MYQVLVVEGFVDLDDRPWQWHNPNSTIEESRKALKRASSLEHPRTQKQNLTRMDQVVDEDGIKPNGNNGWKLKFK